VRCFQVFRPIARSSSKTLPCVTKSRFSAAVAVPGQVLEIHDLRGRLITRLTGRTDGEGLRWIWDGTDQGGVAVASGTYFAGVDAIAVPLVKLTLVR
jgi:hypothetical protein